MKLKVPVVDYASSYNHKQATKKSYALLVNILVFFLSSTTFIMSNYLNKDNAIVIINVLFYILFFDYHLFLNQSFTPLLPLPLLNELYLIIQQSNATNLSPPVTNNHGGPCHSPAVTVHIPLSKLFPMVCEPHSTSTSLWKFQFLKL